MSTQTMYGKILSRIHSKKRGWVFTQVHFRDLGNELGMIHSSIIKKIQRLLEEDRTLHSIEVEVGVSWATIKRVSIGKLRPHAFAFPKHRLFGGVVLRCPKCGAKAEIPEDGRGLCYACMMRSKKGVRSCFQTVLSADSLELDLDKVDKARYETMRKQKEHDRRQGILDSM